MTDRTGSQIDHLNLAVPDLPPMHGFGGAERKPFFWLVADGTVVTNMHFAFTAQNREMVREFHDTALSLGATSLHEPGVWKMYHPHYFGAFVLDPDGVNLETVCHHPG